MASVTPVARPATRIELRIVLGMAALAILGAFLAVGAIGVHRYLLGFWLYRGYAAPHDPAFVTVRGSAERFDVKSAALGGRSQPVDVYLPPGYAANPRRRYPVVYLLHGFPGRPNAFLLTIRAGVLDDALVARHRLQPLILVMPFGSTGTFTDKEWVNGVRPHEGWETFVARDVVRAVDARYRTIPTGAARAIAGLSEGGYGALNIALHHPGEFRVAESWSGYELADPVRSVFGDDRRRLAYNSPLLELRRVVPALRRRRTYVWFYAGTTDRKRMIDENARFAAALARARIHHRFFVFNGGHTWAVWRDHAAAALLAAAAHVEHG